MKIIQHVHSDDFKTYQTEKIRERFLLDGLKEKNKANFVYAHYDRMVTGIITPTSESVSLETYAILRADFFLERREMGVINVGGEGTIVADGTSYDLAKLDCLYMGKGVKEVKFSSKDANDPAIFYALSAPAHATYPTSFLKHGDAFSAQLGSVETANERKIARYIHKDGIQSCQLVMGLTILSNGSVWNTIPPHTHDRRMEVYFYFDVDDEHRVFHYMGEPQETRHIIVANHEAVLSPVWSIHAGSGTKNYSFIWGMAGENLDYADMDTFGVKELK
ncbi:MAG: 5-dehydro-4-deoxy-D-glucuronate isomerase [Chitinophagaceae bacterium]|nr:MAG: 5-dehydro-4-deoxy-D-glucuronate isomerase [Chitinophagaceae bacterium]